MTNMLIDGLLIMLLLYGIRIAKDFHGKYEEIKQLKTDLKGVMRQVQASMKIAEQTVENLQASIKFAAAHVTPHLPKANSLRDDLSFLIDRGESIADKLEILTTGLKKNHLTPQTVVDNEEMPEILYAPVPEKQEPENKTLVRKVNYGFQDQGFFAKLRQVS